MTMPVDARQLIQAIQVQNQQIKDLKQENLSLQAQINNLGATLRRAESATDTLKGVSMALQSMKGFVNGAPMDAGRRHGPMAKSWGGGSLVSLDNVSGRAYPMDLITSIAINGGQMSSANGVIYNNMDGPFVAVSRYAVFLSLYQFTQDGQTYFGRTAGRWRPISSALDVMDAVRAFDQPAQYQPAFVGGVVSGGSILPVANPMGIHSVAGSGTVDVTNMLPNFPGTGRPMFPSPFSMSSQRSMGFDGVIKVETQGSQWQRQSGGYGQTSGVPSHFWEITRDLACYDVFEPGDTILFTVTPTHPLNPEYGNISSLVARDDNFTYDDVTGQGANDPLPVGSWPFITSQFDGHEGINDQTKNGDVSVTTDRIIRNPAGILVIGYHGYRIVQAPQVVQ